MASCAHEAQTCLMQLVCGLPDDVIQAMLVYLGAQDWQSLRACSTRSRRLANQFCKKLTLHAGDLIHLRSTMKQLARHFPGVEMLSLHEVSGGEVVSDELAEAFVAAQQQSGAKGRTTGLLARLTSLDVKGCAFLTAKGMHHLLQATPNLQHLTTTRWSEAASLMDLPSLKHLRTLVLGDSQVDILSVNDAALDVVAQCTSLTSLSLRRCVTISDEGVASLAALPQLSHLCLANTKVTGFHVGALRKLTSLDVSGCSLFRDPALQAAADNLCQLQTLLLEGTSCTNTGLAALQQVVTLDTLVLGPQFELSSVGLEALSHCPALRYLSFGNVNTSRSPPTGAFPALTHMQFGGAFFNRGLRFVFPLGPKLTHVVASGYDTVTDTHLTCLARQTSLTSLELHGGYQLSAAGLKPLQALPHLKHVVLVSCPLLQHIDLKRLVSVNPALNKVLVRKSSWELPEEAITISGK